MFWICWDCWSCVNRYFRNKGEALFFATKCFVEKYGSISSEELNTLFETLSIKEEDGNELVVVESAEMELI